MRGVATMVKLMGCYGRSGVAWGCGAAPMARFSSVRPPQRRGGTGGRLLPDVCVQRRCCSIALVSYMPLAGSSIIQHLRAAGQQRSLFLHTEQLSGYILSSPAAVALLLATSVRCSSAAVTDHRHLHERCADI